MDFEARDDAGRLRPVPPDRALYYDIKDQRLFRQITILGIPGRNGWGLRWYERFGKPWARLDHPGIPAVYELITTAEAVYEIRQHLAGVTLQRFLDEGGRLGPKDVRHLLESLVSILDHAHACGIVHGALYPEQIVLQPRGMVSLQRVVPGLVQAWLGKPSLSPRLLAYQAPEQVGQASARGDARDNLSWPVWARPGGGAVSPATDVYSLGVLLYRLLTGRLPFEALDRQELVAQILTTQPPAVTTRDGFPMLAPLVIARSLSKEPTQRYASAGDLLRALYPGSPLRLRDLALGHQAYQAGLLWMRLPRPEAAVSCWEEARWYCPGEARLESNIGVALLQLGRLEEAERFFQAAVALAPDDDLLRMHLGWALWKLGRAERPIAHLFSEPDFLPEVSDDGEFEPRLLAIAQSCFFRRVSPSWPDESAL